MDEDVLTRSWARTPTKQGSFVNRHRDDCNAQLRVMPIHHELSPPIGPPRSGMGRCLYIRTSYNVSRTSC